MIKEIQYTGYEASTPDNLASDGSLSAAIGLVNQDGGMRAVSKANEVMSLPEGYNIIFKHRISSGEVNYILLNELGDMYWLQEGEEITKDKALVGVQFHNFTGIEAVGNTLVLLSGTPHYILWKSGTYNYLGTKVPNIDISFGLQGNFTYKSSHVDLPETISTSKRYANFSSNNKYAVETAVYAAINSSLKKYTDSGHFCLPFVLRYALRMYDGTIVNRSVPIYMQPCIMPFVNCTEGENSDGIFKIYFSAYHMYADLDYRIINLSYDELIKWKDIIQSIDIFVSKPIYHYKQSGSIPCIKTDYPYNSGYFVGMLRNYSKSETNNSRTRFIDYKNKDAAIESLNLGNGTDRFELTPENIYVGYNLADLLWAVYSLAYEGDVLPLEVYSDSEIKDMMTGEMPCYLFQSINLKDISPDDYSKRVIVNSNINAMKAITAQETIDKDDSFDYYERDQLLAESITNYNNRINLTGVERALYSGHSVGGMLAYKNASHILRGYYNDANDNAHNAKVAFVVFRTQGFSYLTYVEDENGRFLLEANNTDCELSSYISFDTEEKMTCWNYIFFPNPNAKSIYISGINSYGVEKFYKVALEKDDFLNGAHAWLGLYANHYAELNEDDILEIESSCNPSNRVPLFGKIYTSKLNNPFVFSPSDVYSFSGAEIIGMASATKALSQGQFGQFPMYAFTSDGIWALEVSASTGGYSAKQPVTRDVCINPLSITQGDNCIYFVSDRGLMLLSGSETACISDALDDHFAKSLKDTLPGYGKLLGIAGVSEDAAAAIAFREFIKEAQIIYDYINQRLIVFKPAEEGHTNIAYAYSLASRSWSFVENDIYKKLNSYPEALGVSAGGGVVNLSTITDGTEGTGLIVTRPLSLDMPEVHKTVDAIIQRGKFRKGCIKQALWGSRDLIHWHLVASSGSHILRNVHGTPYKWFRIGVIATLKDDEALTGCSINYTPKLTNKIR